MGKWGEIWAPRNAHPIESTRGGNEIHSDDIIHTDRMLDIKTD